MEFETLEEKAYKNEFQNLASFFSNLQQSYGP